MQTQLLPPKLKTNELISSQSQRADEDTVFLYYPADSLADSDSSSKVDNYDENRKIVANKQQSMEELVMALERALSMAKQPSAKADEVISYTREQLENIQNPHRALELELAKLVEAKTPPNGEFYKKRKDKSELSVAFFHRVYGRFYVAGVLYKHQLRAMDADFTHLLAQYKEAPQLPTKQDANDVALAKIGVMNDIVRLASVAARRKSAVV